jgi:hypothetical protein
MRELKSKNLLIVTSLLLSAAVVSAIVFYSMNNRTDLDKTLVPEQIAEAAPDKPNRTTSPQLQQQADSLLHLLDSMPSVPVLITDEPILKEGNNVETAIAYTTCAQRQFPEIFVKEAFYRRANEKQLINALKHELTHAWFCRQGIIADHGPEFRKKFESIGGFGN